MSSRADLVRRLSEVLLPVLGEREGALRVPLLGDGDAALRAVGVVEVPLWADASLATEALLLLSDEGRLAEVGEAELLPLCGRGLPLRRYWGEATRGWRVVTPRA